ncbi:MULTISPECIES: CRISPR-associated endonuclease Cas2 [Acinetobacter]|jgi:CRISPR-associated endonuclease Cas2|uniref:CRISPR-associated endonuclease Cas2 n=1 Tax=Acinetobacter TaxID=469 RepID=UPI00141AAF62|nr:MULTISPECIES: CRISPR-associated endonuclease Cas2 [Acinetobacter]MCS4297574.1 CRISPR-associated endonuclease Cas2 [Acinetobacter guillouiae]MCW2249746.1 CRISPR-associated endonuclease Cas2 [Acinetobacter sp. BIGb0204]MDI1224035.1 CRISPR-associated endonuclease Cas2 [Acinetobacter sp.]NII38850.1 CRISPR-associated endonuclease Cas2 [Acinetobacter sp. BIGb0196]
MQSYLGMYDVSCSKLRSGIFRILSAYGIHQQKSVFECRFPLDQKQQLIQQLSLLSHGHSKRIMVIKVFPNHPQSKLFGMAKRMPKSDCLYIA